MLNQEHLTCDPNRRKIYERGLGSRGSFYLVCSESATTSKLPVKFCLGPLLMTIVWETGSQTALRNCSEEIREEPVYTGIFTV